VPGSVALSVDGATRRIEPGTGRRASALWRVHPGARKTEWAAGVEARTAS
jgi:hypothetical protein